MTTIGFSVMALPVAVLILAAGAGCTGADQEASEVSPPETTQMHAVTRARIDMLAETLDAASWPRPEARYVAPAVDRSFLERPDLVTHSSRACTTVSFEDGLWGKCNWNWRSAQRREKPSAAVAEHAGPGRFEVEGDLLVAVVLTPSAQVAQEYLLEMLADNMMPTDLLAARLEAAQRPTGIGDVAFLTESADGSDIRISFVRHNVYLAVRGHGEFATEALSLARSLDQRVVSQQPLSYAGLVARRPVVEIAPRRTEGLRYDVALSSGQRIADAEARVGGQRVPVSENRILLSDKDRQSAVEVVVISEDLLVGVSTTED